MSYYDFNTANEQASFDVIPHGTIAKVKLKIKPGGCNDEAKGWTKGYATRNNDTGVMYLICEFVVLEGKYAKRKIWSNIGLYSPKNDNKWGDMGRSFIRGILNSARGISDKDTSEEAQAKRRINGLAELDGLEFLAKIEVEKDQKDKDRNVIKYAVTPDHKEYAAIMSAVSTAQMPAAASSTAPSWAQ